MFVVYSYYEIQDEELKSDIFTSLKKRNEIFSEMAFYFREALQHELDFHFWHNWKFEGRRSIGSLYYEWDELEPDSLGFVVSPDGVPGVEKFLGEEIVPVLLEWRDLLGLENLGPKINFWCSKERAFFAVERESDQDSLLKKHPKLAYILASNFWSVFEASDSV